MRVRTGFRTLVLFLLVLPVALFASGGGEKKLVLMMQQSPQGDALKAIVPDFEKATGVKVEVQSYPYDAQMNNYRMEYNSKSGQWDVLLLSGAWMQEGIKAKYHVPLNQFDMSQLKKDDIPHFGVIGSADGIPYGVPWFGEFKALFLRSDLLNDPKEKAAFKAKYGYDLDIPKTEEQYWDQLKFFHRPDKGLSGTIFYGKRHVWIQIPFQTMLRARGLSYINCDTFEPYGSTPGVIQGMKDYKAAFQYAAPSSLNDDWFTGNALWQSGAAYSISTWSTVLLYSNDPQVSKIAGKVIMTGYPTKLPKVEGLMVQDLLSVSSTSKNKDLAWKFITWAVSKESMVNAVLKAPLGHVPMNYAAMVDPEANKKLPLAKMADMLKGYSRVLPSEPPLAEGTHIDLEVLTKDLSLYINGDLTAEQAGKQLDDEINKILVDGKYPTPWLKK